MTMPVMTGEDATKPHYVIIPLMAQGHMIPMMDFARQLAERGVLTTIITTPLNAARIRTTIENAEASHLPLRFISLPFPCAEAGLPEGCENIDVLPSTNLLRSFFDATFLLGPPLEACLRAHSTKPTCIISDTCHPWTTGVARNLGIPRVGFFSISCFSVLCEHNNGDLNDITDINKPFVVPGLADRIEVTKAQSPGFFPGPEWASFRNSLIEAHEASLGMVVNTFHDLEPWYVEAYEKAMGQKVWPVGPLSLYNEKAGDVASRGCQASIDQNWCLTWLDSMGTGSVVYVSFGSLARVPLVQLMEIGLGLEASGRPFIWVVKEATTSTEVASWLSDVFEERVKSRGLIIRGWAPQVVILSHPAVGGFVTHCGWNSTLEGVVAGVPMVTWPFFADQFLNERMIIEVLRIGVGVGVKSPNYWAFQSDLAPTVVGRGEVEAAVQRVMEGGMEANERRERARELGRKAKEAVKKTGSSHSNITLLIESVAKVCHQSGAQERNDL